MLIDTLALDTVDPACDLMLVALGNIIKEAAANAVSGGDEEVIGTIKNGATKGESVKNEGGAEGLIGEMIKGDGKVLEVVVVCGLSVVIGTGQSGGGAWGAARAG